MSSSILLLFVLGGTSVTLIGSFYPVVMLSLFLFFNLLFPKLPLIQIQNYMVPIRIEDVFLMCALLSLLLRHFIYGERYALNPLRRWMVAFAVVTGMSFVFGLFILGSVPGAKVGFLYWLRGPEYFAAAYLCIFGVTTWKQYRQLFASFVVFVSLVGVYGLLQEFALVPAFNAMHLTDEIVTVQVFSGFGEERLISTFAAPGDLAAFYLLAIPLLTSLFVLTVGTAKRFLLGIVAVLSFLCFYLTYARAPLVALILVLAVCFWLLGKRGWGFLVGPLCLFPAYMFGGFEERIDIAANDPFASYSLGGRIVGGWTDALGAFFRSPLLGTGPASIGNGMGVDGMYLMLLGTWGVIGLVCFLVLIAKAMRLQWICMHNSHSCAQRALAIGLYAGTVGLLVNAISLDSFFLSKVAFAYWFLVGLLSAGAKLEEGPPGKEGSSCTASGLPTCSAGKWVKPMLSLSGRT